MSVAGKENAGKIFRGEKKAACCQQAAFDDSKDGDINVV
jgi:hypothetical protein